MKISHSAKNKYTTCPRQYWHHYIQRLRSPKLGSALFFGNALDDAFSHLLLNKKVLLTEAELTALTTKTAEEVFAERMLETKNDAGQIVQLAQSPFADYYTSDFDASLFTNETIALVSKLDKTYNDLPKIVAFHEYCKLNLNPRNKNKKRLTDYEYVLYNYINWLSLNEKGKLMVNAYREQILPHIQEVFSIQKEISIVNEMGDEITGKIDFTASFTDSPGTTYICDNKSSSKAYAEDSVAESEQLATYCEAEGISNAAFVVVQKGVLKKAPFIKTQIIKDTVSVSTIEKTFDIYANVVHNIATAGGEKDSFPQNWDSCFAFGKICPYYQICKHNKTGNLIDCSPKSKERDDDKI